MAFIETQDGTRLSYKDWGTGPAGGADPVPIAVPGKAAAAAVPGDTFRVDEGAPHAVPLTHAARLNGDLPAFLKGWGLEPVRPIGVRPREGAAAFGRRISVTPSIGRDRRELAAAWRGAPDRALACRIRPR